MPGSLIWYRSARDLTWVPENGKAADFSTDHTAENLPWHCTKFSVCVLWFGSQYCIEITTSCCQYPAPCPLVTRQGWYPHLSQDSICPRLFSYVIPHSLHKAPGYCEPERRMPLPILGGMVLSLNLRTPTTGTVFTGLSLDSRTHVESLFQVDHCALVMTLLQVKLLVATWRGGCRSHYREEKQKLRVLKALSCCQQGDEPRKFGCRACTFNHYAFRLQWKDSV